MNKDFEVVILSACRTPIGSFGGALKDMSAVDLGAIAIREALARGNVNPADVGDCIKASGSSFTTVDCDASDAQYKILGVDGEDRTFAEAASQLDSVCGAFPTTTYVAWYGDEGKKGTVYCAGPVSGS